MTLAGMALPPCARGGLFGCAALLLGRCAASALVGIGSGGIQGDKPGLATTDYPTRAVAWAGLVVVSRLALFDDTERCLSLLVGALAR